MSKVISFAETAVYKRRMWWGAIAMIAVVGVSTNLDGAILRHPIIGIVPLCILGGFFAFFLSRHRIGRLADEVIDEGDHLQVRRGKVIDEVTFSNIDKVEFAAASRMRYFRLGLAAPCKLGTEITFRPPREIWSNQQALHRMALDLAERAAKAQGGGRG